MTDKNLTQVDESADDTLRNLSIGDLRKYAKLMSITAQRDWTAEDYIRAIKAQQEAAKYTSQLSSDSTLAPGYARVLIHKDPTPGHANSHVPLSLNGRTFLVPRGTPQTVPIEYVGVLADARSYITTQKKEPSREQTQGEVVEELIQSYPFQVLEMRPHTDGSAFVSRNDQRAARYAKRAAFRDIFAKWPTDAELQKWESEKRITA